MWQANHFLALQVQFHASHFNTIVCRWHLACKGLIAKEIIFHVGAQPPLNTGNYRQCLCYHCLLLGALLGMQQQFFPVQIQYSAWVFFTFSQPRKALSAFCINEALNNFSSLKWPQSYACGSFHLVLLHESQSEPLGAQTTLLFCLQSVWHNRLVHSEGSRCCSKMNARVNAISGTAEIH